MKILYFLIVLLVVIIAVMHFFPQINFRPMPGGLCEAKLDAKKPNWVSSLVDSSDPHYIKPLEPGAPKQRAQCLFETFKNLTVTHVDDSHLIAYRQTTVFNFVDWLCIKANGDVTSSATLGHSDLGKNRELVETIRALC